MLWFWISPIYFSWYKVRQDQGWGQLRSWSWVQLQLRSWSWNWSWNLRSWSWYSGDWPELELKLMELELELIFKRLAGVGVGVETPGVGVGIGVETLRIWNWSWKFFFFIYTYIQVLFEIYNLETVPIILCLCNGPLACWLNHSRERLRSGAVVVIVLSCVIWTRQHWFAQEQSSQHDNSSWQSVWQPYIHTNMQGSQPDNFIVVSLTTLQAIQWCQAFCCDGCGAVHKTNTQSKVNGLYCDKSYVQVAFSHIKNRFKPWFTN